MAQVLGKRVQSDLRTLSEAIMNPDIAIKPTPAVRDREKLIKLVQLLPDSRLGHALVMLANLCGPRCPGCQETDIDKLEINDDDSVLCASCHIKFNM